MIPTLNEECLLPSCLASVEGQGAGEVIVVDGGSKDRTAALAREAGAFVLSVVPAQRAAQANAGAHRATGDVILFVDADCRLPHDAVPSIERLLAHSPNVVGGCFAMKLHRRSGFYRLITRGGDLYCRMTRTLFSDRGLFVRRHAFEALGGFRSLPIMEDVDLGRRLRRLGQLHMLPGPVVASARRFQRDGPVLTAARIAIACLLFQCGFRPERIADLYQRTGSGT